MYQPSSAVVMIWSIWWYFTTKIRREKEKEVERGREMVDRTELYNICTESSSQLRGNNDKCSPLQIILFLPCTQHEGIREEIKQTELTGKNISGSVISQYYNGKTHFPLVIQSFKLFACIFPYLWGKAPLRQWWCYFYHKVGVKQARNSYLIFNSILSSYL